MVKSSRWSQRGLQPQPFEPCAVGTPRSRSVTAGLRRRVRRTSEAGKALTEVSSPTAAFLDPSWVERHAY